MYLWLIGGVGLLLALYLAGRLFAAANPAALARGLRWTVIALAALLALFVLARGLLAAAALLGTVAAFAWRSGSVLRLLSLFASLFGAARAARAARAPPGGATPGGAAPSASAVETAWLAMRLDHITGDIDGAVRQGPFEGRRLGSLSRDEMFALWLAVRDDAQSLRLLETFLDRAGEDWRADFAARARASGAGPASPAGGMTREEALSILGLEEGAGAERIKEAHRGLMKKLHPDHGGSDYFAAKLNQAKATLLGE